MEFEPVIFVQFEPRILTGFKPFEPMFSNRLDNSLVRHLHRELLRELTVLYNNTARTTSRYVARAVWLVWKTATAHGILSRRKGGSK